MYDESTNTSSQSHFATLKKQCYMAVHRLAMDPVLYSQIYILAKEYEDDLARMSFEEIVHHCGPNQKITAIKAIRDKCLALGLAEAKYIVDGYYRRWGWEK